MASWSASYEAVPAGSASPSLGDDAIRSLKEEIRHRMDNEHTVYSDATSAGERLNDWLHIPGSARAYYQADEPTTLPNGNALTSETEVSKGTLWVDSDSDNYPMYVWSGSEFKPVNTKAVTRIIINGPLGTGTDLLSPVIFPQGVTILRVDARVSSAPTGSGLRVDLNKNGNTSIFSTTEYIEIAAAAYSATITSDALSGTHSILTEGDYLTLDIDQVGSTEPGDSLSISIVGTVA